MITFFQKLSQVDLLICKNLVNHGVYPYKANLIHNGESHEGYIYMSDNLGRYWGTQELSEGAKPLVEMIKNTPLFD